MSDHKIIQKNSSQNLFITILPIMISVFSVYLSMGMILGVLPTYIRGNLGFSTVIVGLAIGLQSLATLLTRAYAGKIKDTQGGKQSNNLGAVLMLLTGFLYLVCTFCGSNFILALVFILLGRIVTEFRRAYLLPAHWHGLSTWPGKSNRAR